MSARPSFDDRTDFDNAERGFVAALTPGVIKAADGRVVWNSDAYAFLDAPCPDTANPSLWRQGQLCSKQGLFQVTDGIYQVRDLDLSNVSFIEGDSGVIVIDPLISTECAAAALSLYREQRGDRPVTAVIYTHSHGDHFGGVRGVVPDGASIPIIAPADPCRRDRMLAGLATRIRGPGRPLYAALFALTLAWAIHQAVDGGWRCRPSRWGSSCSWGWRSRGRRRPARALWAALRPHARRARLARDRGRAALGGVRRAPNRAGWT